MPTSQPEPGNAGPAKPPFFPEHGERSARRRPGHVSTSSALIALSAAILIMGVPAYFLWQVPIEGPNWPEGPAAPRIQKRSPAPAAPAAQPKSADEEQSGLYENLADLAGEQSASAGHRQPVATLMGGVPGGSMSAPPASVESDIPVGIMRASLMEALGKPDLSAHTLEQQRLMEIFVYLENTDKATFVLMQDGKVVSVSTGIFERSGLQAARRVRRRF